MIDAAQSGATSGPRGGGAGKTARHSAALQASNTADPEIPEPAAFGVMTGVQPNSLFARRRRCWLRSRQSSLASVQIINALGLGYVGKCALEVAHAIEDDAAVDVGIREVRIEIDRKIEVGESEVDVTIGIGQDAPLSLVFGIVHPEIASRWDIGRRRSAVRILHRCSGAWHCRLLGGLGTL